jgi:hypothetical protein
MQKEEVDKIHSDLFFLGEYFQHQSDGSGPDKDGFSTCWRCSALFDSKDEADRFCNPLTNRMLADELVVYKILKEERDRERMEKMSAVQQRRFIERPGLVCKLVKTPKGFAPAKECPPNPYDWQSPDKWRMKERPICVVKGVSGESFFPEADVVPPQTLYELGWISKTELEKAQVEPRREEMAVAS